jgi:hypothetical protein
MTEAEIFVMMVMHHLRSCLPLRQVVALLAPAVFTYLLAYFMLLSWEFDSQSLVHFVVYLDFTLQLFVYRVASLKVMFSKLRGLTHRSIRWRH